MITETEKGTRDERRKLAYQQERLYFDELRCVTCRPITYKEASFLVRRLRWHLSIVQYQRKPILLADIWGRELRVASVASFQSMTPSSFWERLRTLDPYRVAQVERSIF